MRTTRFRHALTVVTAAAVLASMTAATVASPASAAKPRCQGKVATIVGTRKNDVIRGTAKRDIIVAKGGNDRIYGRGGNDLVCAGGGNDLVVGGPGADTLWGQLGNDRLHGGPGPDFLAGQVGDDTLNGGLSVDTCYQGTGVGEVKNCELPAPPPPPPPPPPTLVVAYVDANGNHTYDAGDVMIAEIVDTNGSGNVNPGDTINMGQYPTTPLAVTPAALRQTTEAWRVTSHTVNTTDTQPANLDITIVGTTVPNHVFLWQRIGGTSPADAFGEIAPGQTSAIADFAAAGDNNDYVDLKLASPSQPSSEFRLEGDSKGDDGFIDVEILAP